MKLSLLLSRFIPWLLLAISAVFLFQFSVSDKLAGFADDSGTYMIMAGNLSPYYDPPLSHQQSFHYHHLPPGFPLLVALLGIDGNIPAIHALIILTIFATAYICILLFRVSDDDTSNAWPALILVLIPGLWIESLKLSAEHQYMFLSLLALYLLRKNVQSNWSLVFIAIIIGLTFLTRTIGITLLPVFIIYLLKGRNHRHIRAIPSYVAISLTPLLIWSIAKPDIQHSYFRDMLNIYSSKNSIFDIPVTNLNAIINAWFENIGLYSSNLPSWHAVIIIIAGALALYGIILRIRESENLYLLGYASVLVIWPYPEDMPRFVYPVLPLLLLSIFHAIKHISIFFQAGKATVYVFIILMMATVLPGMQEIAQRYRAAETLTTYQITHIPEFYTIRDLQKAYSTAVIWSEAAEIMKSLQPVSQAYGKTLTVKPQFLTFYSNIYAEKMPVYQAGLHNEYINYLKQHEVRNILITTIPVTRPADNIDIISALAPVTEELFTIYHDSQQGKTRILTMLAFTQ